MILLFRDFSAYRAPVMCLNRSAQDTVQRASQKTGEQNQRKCLYHAKTAKSEGQGRNPTINVPNREASSPKGETPPECPLLTRSLKFVINRGSLRLRSPISVARVSSAAVLTAPQKKRVVHGGRRDPNLNAVTPCPRVAREVINPFAITFFHVHTPPLS